MKVDNVPQQVITKVTVALASIREYERSMEQVQRMDRMFSPNWRRYEWEFTSGSTYAGLKARMERAVEMLGKFKCVAAENGVDGAAVIAQIKAEMNGGE